MNKIYTNQLGISVDLSEIVMVDPEIIRTYCPKIIIRLKNVEHSVEYYFCNSNTKLVYTSLCEKYDNCKTGEAKGLVMDELCKEIKIEVNDFVAKWIAYKEWSK